MTKFFAMNAGDSIPQQINYWAKSRAFEAVFLLVLALSGCCTNTHPKFPGTRPMVDAEAQALTRQLLDWQNCVADDRRANQEFKPVDTLDVSPFATASQVADILQLMREFPQQSEGAFKPDPDFTRWELMPDAIVAQGTRSVIHGKSDGVEITNAGKQGLLQKADRENWGGPERKIEFRGQTVSYHNESFVKRVPFSSIKAILKKGNSILIFEHSYLNSLTVTRNLQYQSRLRSEKFKHPHYHGFASLVLELPKGRPASDYGSALLALCPAANKVDPEIVYLPKSHQRAIWLLNRL